MNKIFMTKRRNDGKIVVCSELTRARGKMKSVVTAVAAAVLSVGAVAADDPLVPSIVDNWGRITFPTYIDGEVMPIGNHGRINPHKYINWIRSKNLTELYHDDGYNDITVSNTLALFTSCEDSDIGLNDFSLVESCCTGLSYMVFQDTDNTTTVSSDKSFLTVNKTTAENPNNAQGIGYNTDYKLDFNYDPETLTVIDKKLTVSQVYFHTNDGTGTQGAGNATTNLGKLTDKAGATGKFSVTAGVNVTAKGEGAFAAGYNVTTVGNGGITIGDSSNVSTTMVEWVASDTKNDSKGDKGVYYTKITTTKNGNQVTVTREIYKDTNNLAKVTRDDLSNPEKITDVDVTGLTPVTFAEASQTTSTGASGTASIAMGADKIPMDLSLVTYKKDGTIDKDGRSDVSKIAIINRSPITVARGQEISNNGYAERITTSMQDINWAPTASGEAAVAIGAKTTAQGEGSVALGPVATALSDHSISIGVGAITRSFLDPYSKGVQSGKSVAIGYLATSENQGSVSLGQQAQALHDQALALGAFTKASGFNSAAIGNNNKATGYGAFVIGGDDAGTKDVVKNKIEGANTEYATLTYNPVTGEVVANTFVPGSIKGADNAPVQGTVKVYKSGTVDITEQQSGTLYELKYVIDGTGFVSGDTDKFKAIVGKTLTTRALSEDEKKTLREQGYTVLEKSQFNNDIEALALTIADPLGYISATLEKYKVDLADNKITQAEFDALKKALYDTHSLKNKDAPHYSPYQEATSSGVGSIAFGLKTQATQDGAIAMGVASNAHAKESIAVGVGTVTTGERAVSVGSRSIASGERSIAIGTYSEAPDAAHGETRYDSPRALADDAVAIGTGAYVGLDVQGTKSVALGSGSIVTTGHGDIKENLTTGAWEGILRNYKSYDPNKEPGINNATLGETHKQFNLGKTTTGGTTGTINKAYVGKILYTKFAGETAKGAVSVGYSGSEKRIQNVAAGEISPTSTDAINGSQLYMVAYELGKEVESSYFHVNRADSTQQVGDTNTNQGKLDDYAGARSDYAVTAGVNTRAVGNGSISMGHDALSGMTTEQYREMAEIDEALQSNITKKATAENQLAGVKKTKEYVTTQSNKIGLAIAQYDKNIETLTGIIKGTTNADEVARLNAQLNNTLTSKNLLEEQLVELAKMKDAANETEAKATQALSDAQTAIDDNAPKLAKYLKDNKKDYALAIGSQAIASGEKSIAIGKDNNASGNQSIAIGTGNIVSGDRSGAFGDPSIVAGAGSYTQGNDNAVGSQAKNVGAFGNNNQIGAKATYGTDGKLDSAQDLTAESAVENSKVLGNNNYINSSNTYVLGSGVGIEGTDTFGTVENSVYLGNDSTISQNAGANKKADNTDGTTTTAGATGVVKTAELLGVTYGEFAAHTAKGAVTVGSAGAERRIMNVAAGEISKTSTDAINGSQLYYVAKQAAKPFSVTANTNNDTDAKTMDDIVYKAKDGKQVQLGETLNIAGSGTSKTLTRDTTNATTDGTYSAKNIQTIVDDAGVQIQFAEKPEFKEVTAKDGNKVSKLSPTNITTTDGTSTTTIAPDSITVGDKAGDTDKPVTITSGQNGGTISNLDGNLDGAKSGTQAPTTSATKPTLTESNAATVGDVLNAGWNLQGNGQAVDFVKPYDTVNFVDGVGTTVEATSDGATSVIKVNTVMQYTDANGNPVKKIGDNYYPNDVVVAKDGKVYPAGTQLDQDGNVAAGTAEAAPVTTVQINTVNPDGTSTTATKLGNVDAGSNTYAGDKNVTKVGDKYYNTADVVNGVPKENAQPLADKPTTNTAFDGLANLDASNPTNVMTVADAKNLGWVVSASGNGYADDVRNANQVDFKGTGLATVKGETKDGIRTITVDVNAQNTVESAQTPVVYTDADGNKLSKGQDGNFYKASDIQNLVFNPVDNKYYPAGTAFDENGNPKANADGTTPTPVDLADKVVNKDKVIASMNNGNNETKPTALSNVGSNLTPTTSGDTLINQDGTTTAGQTPTKVAKAPTAEEAKKMNNNAATVGDVLNAGWNLQGNGSAVDFVKPYDTVNFVDGVGTLVKATSNGTTSVIQVDIDKTTLTNNANGGVENPTKAAQEALAAAKKALDEANAGTDEAAKEAAAKDVQAAQKALDKANNQIATAQDVANAINESGWNVIAEANGGVVSGSNKELVKPSETVSLKAGKNIEIAQEGQNFTFRTSANPEFNSVTVGEPAYQKADGTPVNKVGDKYYTADGQEVAAGDVVKATKPAVNMTAEAAKPATNNGNNPPSTALNITSADGKPTQITGVGSSLNTKAITTSPTGNGGTTENIDLVDLVGTDTAPINKNAAATVGDLANMGWVVSATGNGYKDAVKNANQVDFVGTGLATVKGETNATTGIRTITVDVNAQNTVEAADTPVIYTDTNGNKLTKVGDNFYKVDDVTVINGKAYPKDSVEIDGKVYPAGSVKDPVTGKVMKDGQEVAEQTASTPVNSSDVIASMNDGDNKADNPKQLANVKGNLAPTYNKGDATETAGKLGDTTADAPTTSQKAPEAADVKKMYNNAATVGDVLNAGWNLQGNGSAVDFVKPYDTVNFVDGVGTLVKATSNGTTSVIQVDIDKTTLTNNANGGVENPTKAAQEALAAAKKALDEANAGTDEAAKEAAAKDVQAAQKALDKANNQIATAQDVANAINESGWNVIAEANGGVVSGSNKELVKPSETVSLKAGKNIEIAQEGQNFTFRTSANPEFNSVTVGSDVVYKDKDGNELVKGQDGKFYNKAEYDAAPKDADGNPILTGLTEKAVDNAKSEAPVKLAQDKGVGTSHTDTAGVKTDKDAPSALSVKDSLGENSQINGIASALDTKDVKTQPNGTASKDTLVDLTYPKLPDNATPDEEAAYEAAKAKWASSAVTVGDIANMGWVVSASDNGYTDTVKNANKVNFVGTGLATVTGETKDGVRTITVDVDAQRTVETADTPVIYTDGKGNKLTKVGDTFYNAEKYENLPEKPTDTTAPDYQTKLDAYNAALKGAKVDAGDVIASMNDGDSKADNPKQLANVKGNLAPTYNKGDATETETDGKPNGKLGDTTAAAPTTSQKAPEAADVKKMYNNAATVGDVLNAGWNLQGNGVAKDFVKPYDTVNFVDGTGTKVDVTTSEDGKTSTIKVNVDAGTLKAETKDGKETGKVLGADTAALNKAVTDAQAKVDEAKAAKATADAGADDAAKEKAAQDLAKAEKALADAQAAKDAVPNKVATVENVAEAISKSGFTLKTSATTGGEKLSGEEELINPGDVVEMIAGKNLTVKQDTDGKVTYATKDDVEFNTVQVGGKVDDQGNKLVKVGDSYYKATDLTDGKPNAGAKPVENADVKDAPSVVFSADKGVATKDTKLDKDGKEITTPNDAPTALSVKDKDGKDSQVNGIASALDTKEVATKPTGKDGVAGKDTLVDLTAPTDPTKKAKWASSAVTVGDIANMGWVVSASGNGYTDTVKNANKVDFKGENGISVTGKTTDAGVREITIAIEKGEVIGANEGTVNIDGKDTDVVKVGDKYFKKEDIDPTTGKPKDGTTALGDNIVGNNGQNVVNNGNKFVDGHTVAKAIQESGFTVGKETNTTGVEFNNSDEKVNPNDELRFADGKGTTVSTGTVKTIDPNGEVSTKTVVKVDVDTGVITNNANGSLKGVVSAADAKKLNDDLAKAQAALAAVEKLGDSAPQNVKDAAKAAVYDAEKAIEKAGLNKVATVQNVAEAINNSGWNAKVAKTGSGEADDKGGDALVNPGDTVTMTAGDNMKITKEGLNYTIETKKDVTFDSVTANSVNIGPVTLTGSTVTNPDGSATNELSVGTAEAPTRITNVAPGVKDADAVNVSQLKGVQNNINQRLGDVYQKMDREHKNLRAGIAGAAALAGIPEVHVAGRSMIAAAASAYKSENAIAVGYSRLSDNSKIKLKLTGSANTRGDVMGTVGVGYMW